MTKETAIAQSKPSSVAPAEPPAADIIAPIDMDLLEAQYKKFEEFKKRILTENDIIQIAADKDYLRKKVYLRKSAWRKWALACNVSDSILLVKREPEKGVDENGNYSFRVEVKAYSLASGRSSVGVAIAAKNEKSKWSTHEEHDIFTLAHTRAKNRAIADLIGGGEVSAEEVEDLQPTGEQKHLG